MSRRVLTITEAADRIGRSRDFVRRLIAAGSVAARQENTRWYVNESSLDEWAACGAEEPPAPEPIYQIPAVVTPGRRHAA